MRERCLRIEKSAKIGVMDSGRVQKEGTLFWVPHVLLRDGVGGWEGHCAFTSIRAASGSAGFSGSCDDRLRRAKMVGEGFGSPLPDEDGAWAPREGAGHPLHRYGESITAQEELSRWPGQEYELGGVREYWLLDPEGQRADFYKLGEDGRYRLSDPEASGVYRSKALPGFWLRVAWFWQEPLPAVLEVLRELELI